MEDIIPIILGVSLANERLIEILKTHIPWLENKMEASYLVNTPPKNERLRKTVLQLLTILTGWVTATFFTMEYPMQGWWSAFWVGQIHDVHVFLVGIMASAGSVFWDRILGFTKVLRDDRRQHMNLERFRQREGE